MLTKDLTVTRLNEMIKDTLDSSLLLRNVSLVGEISNFKFYPSGHLYFSLKDEGAAINCVMFRDAASRIGFRPENGMNVRLKGRVSLYGKTGSCQFYAEGMEKEGEGELFRRYEAMKMRLQAEGLFDPSRKKKLPLLPRCVGIVTSESGAVLHDIQTVAHRRNPNMPLCLCPVKVQGEGAAEEIARALRRLDRIEGVQVIIVGRGGGSMEDLWAFNEECVARAIAECQTPVVSAVGHETDYTIADFTADVRAATPSAAAELCVVPKEQLQRSLQDNLRLMERVVTSRLSARENTLTASRMILERNAPDKLLERSTRRLDAALQRAAAGVQQGLFNSEIRLSQAQARIYSAMPEKELENARLQLDRLLGRLHSASKAQLESMENRLERAKLSIQAASPAETLNRGYAIVKKDGAAVSSAKSAMPGDELTILFRDGSITVKVL